MCNFRYLQNKKYKTTLYRKLNNKTNGNVNYVPVNKLGNGKFLKEYLEATLIGGFNTDGVSGSWMSGLASNNIEGKQKISIPVDNVSQKINKFAESEESLKIMNKDREDSKDCN